ncbi:hypothetical protein AAHC03_01997 [Spirometra sp. Aus1]
MQVSREQKRALQVLIDGVEKWYAEWRKLRPRNVGPLYHLTELNLARTGLRVLPSSGILGALPRLQVLNLQDNCISSLNGALWRCEQLLELRLDRNQLHSVRGEFPNIHCLKVLTMSGNNIYSLPELLSEFHALHFVEELNFAGNPLAYEPFYRETILARFPRLVKLDDVAVYAITGRRRPVREKTKYESRRKSKSLVPRRVKQKAPRVSERSQAVQTPKSCLRKLADLQEAEFPVAKVDETWEIHSQ